jgi:hypothetical protein
MLAAASSSTASSAAGAQQRSFMSTQPLDTPVVPDYESQMMLILGKPGGGKGTISGKILKVRTGQPTTACVVGCSLRSQLKWCGWPNPSVSVARTID